MIEKILFTLNGEPVQVTVDGDPRFQINAPFRTPLEGGQRRDGSLGLSNAAPEGREDGARTEDCDLELRVATGQGAEPPRAHTPADRP